MVFFRKYTDIKGFLKRWTVMKIGKLHIRIHDITGADTTTLLHTHPFWYISVILCGGYTEIMERGGVLVSITHNAPCVIFRSSKTYHRIDETWGRCKTLFIAFGNYGWNAKNMVDRHEPLLLLYSPDSAMWSKRDGGIWFISNRDYDMAKNETRHSIHQSR